MTGLSVARRPVGGVQPTVSALVMPLPRRGPRSEGRCRRSSDQEPCPVAPSPFVPELPAPGDGLDPPEGFFDPLADALAGGVARMAGGAAVDGAAAVGGVLSDGRCDADPAAVRDEVSGVVGLVRGH